MNIRKLLSALAYPWRRYRARKVYRGMTLKIDQGANAGSEYVITDVKPSRPSGWTAIEFREEGE